MRWQNFQRKISAKNLISWRNQESAALDLEKQSKDSHRGFLKVSTISEFVGYGKLAVYDWLRRYRRDGLDGLREKGRRGVRPLMDLSDTTAVKEAVRKYRLSIRTAKAEWEKSSGKQVSDITFRRFLDLLAQDISV